MATRLGRMILGKMGTASQAYCARQTTIEKLLAVIEKGRFDHACKHAGSDGRVQRWGPIDDLASVEQALRIAAHRLGLDAEAGQTEDCEPIGTVRS